MSTSKAEHTHDESTAQQTQTSDGDICALTFDVLDTEAIASSVCRPSCGGTVLFIGTTRDSFQGETGDLFRSRSTTYQRALLRLISFGLSYLFVLRSRDTWVSR